MGPKKGKRKGKQEQDDQFQQSEKKMASKWAEALQQNDDGQADPQQLYSKPTKAIFDFDFKHVAYVEEPKPVQRDKYADFTAEELQQLQRIKQKAKADKQVKNQVKNEKKKERKKQIQALKLVEQAQKQKQLQDKKKLEQQISKQKKKQASPWIIPLSLLGFLILMFFLQYQRQIHERLSKFQNNQIDYYQILEADQSTTDKQLKNKYKKLVLKYHPDRNPDCQNCKQKFDKIMMAWQVLGDQHKRKQYDQNSGFISQLKSISTTLTPHNHHYLIDQANQLWIVQVFDSTSTYSKYFSQFWEELVMNYGDFMSFGRVDIWSQSEMSSYLPYKFQIFPSVYVHNKGYVQICSFSFQSPSQGLKKCIDEVLSKTNQKTIPQIPAQHPKSDKIIVYLDGKLRANLRIKAITTMLQNQFDFYFTEKQQTIKKATVYYKHQSFIYNFTQNSKQIMNRFSQFLQSFIVQQVSTCRFLHQCEQRRCILILNRTRLAQVQKQLPLIKENSKKLPIYVLSDSTKQLEKQINQMKEHFDNFQIGVYEGGRVDLGYANEADILNPEEGERLDLQCKYVTWKDRIIELIKYPLIYLGKQEEV